MPSARPLSAVNARVERTTLPVDAEQSPPPLSQSERAVCFLCAYSDAPCDVVWRDGKLLIARERDAGSGCPVVTLLAEDGERVEIELSRGHRDAVRPLAALPEHQRRLVRVRVIHLLRRHSAGDPGHVQRLRATPVSLLVVEPDLLLNITDINNAEYCVRQYPLRRMVPSPPNAATLRGSIIHSAFKELLKGGTTARGDELRRALASYSSELALRQLSPADMAAEAEPHMRALWSWYDAARESLWGHAGNVRAETFLLAPEVGLKGRLDFLLTEPGGQTLLELKTGQATSQLPKREHRWQVHGYQTLLATRHPGSERKQGAAILYSGTPGHAEMHGIPFILRDLHHVIALRNQLALVHTLGSVPPPPAPTKCARCMIRRECQRASALLGWQPPDLEEHAEPPLQADVAWFAEMYELLSMEGRAAEAEARALWSRSPEERRADGVALGGLAQHGEPERTENGEWRYTFACENTSELREGDAILLSDGDPVRGAVVTGNILRLNRRGVTVWTPERIERPALIDRYDSDLVHDRTVRNLWRWLDTEPRLRELVSGARSPEFEPALSDADFPPGLNEEQRAAIVRALAARDYLLIQGPPGTGKTSVVSEIARRAMARGERVLLAAFTNQAVDNALLRLAQDGARDFVRLGHELSVAPALRRFRLSAGETSDGSVDGERVAARLRDRLARASLVAATAATWASDSYDAADEALRFDVALVDEASQLTVPALLGPLRFVRRFILVGDERQLPPLVVDEEAAQRGLKKSLFARLLETHGERASVALRVQYRMHPAICAFPSQEFYRGALVAAGEAQSDTLEIPPAPANPLWDVLRPDQPLVFVDVGDGNSALEAASKVSQAQALVTLKLVRELLALGVPAREIGVIAPFRAQVSAIRQRLERLSPADAPDDERVIVDTVDRFQGGERAVMLLSFGGRAVSQARGLAFLADPNRLNVALTRARRKLILIGERKWLRQEPLLGRLIASCAELYGGHGGIVTARTTSTRS